MVGTRWMKLLAMDNGGGAGIGRRLVRERCAQGRGGSAAPRSGRGDIHGDTPVAVWECGSDACTGRASGAILEVDEMLGCDFCDFWVCCDCGVWLNAHETSCRWKKGSVLKKPHLVGVASERLVEEEEGGREPENGEQAITRWRK